MARGWNGEPLSAVVPVVALVAVVAGDWQVQVFVRSQGALGHSGRWSVCCSPFLVLFWAVLVQGPGAGGGGLPAKTQT